MNETPEIQPQVASLFLINRSSVKKYALEVSKQRRAGKFTRVSVEFLNDVEAEIDRSIRAICTGGNLVTPAPGTRFVTGKSAAKAAEKLELLAMKVVDRKVMRHPSLGCTLK